MVGFFITSSGSSQRLDLSAPKIALLGAGALALAACSAETQSSAHAEEVAAAVASAEQADVEEIDATTLEKLAKDKKVRVIDVRTDAEVAEGMIPGAEHIELDKFDPAKLDFSDGREPVLYCRSDRRSEMAAKKLAKHMGKKVKHLDGGINSWREKGLPLAKPAVF